MDEPQVEFKECWSVAGRHIQSQTHDATINWMKADLTPPLLEHLSFRLGNQLFFVRIVDVDNILQVPGTLEGLESVANACNGHACLLPMRLSDGQWLPLNPRWGLIDANSGARVDPYSLITDEKIEMTDWELHDFAVQIVRDHIKNTLGFPIISSQGNPNVNPSLWFVGEGGSEWVVVRAVKYPERDAPRPQNTIQSIAEEHSKLSSFGHFASVAVVSAIQEFEPPDNSSIEPLWRGYGMYVNFQGLEKLDFP